MFLFMPMYSENSLELVIVEATTARFAPYEGLARAAAATLERHGREPEASAGGSRGSSSCSPMRGLFDHVASRADALGPSSLGLALDQAALRRRAKRRLVAAHLMADALHRVAWRSELKPASSTLLHKLNPAFFQVRSEGWSGLPHLVSSTVKAARTITRGRLFDPSLRSPSTRTRR